MPDSQPSPEALSNIEDACKLFYSNLERQIALAGRQRAEILNLALRAATFAGSEGGGAAISSELLQKTAANLPEMAKDTTAAPAPAAVVDLPSEDESALINLTNVVKNINLLMQNAIAGNQQLDALAGAVLARSVELALDNAVSAKRGGKATQIAAAG